MLLFVNCATKNIQNLILKSEIAPPGFEPESQDIFNGIIIFLIFDFHYQNPE